MVLDQIRIYMTWSTVHRNRQLNTFRNLRVHVCYKFLSSSRKLYNPITDFWINGKILCE
jgi:hypothetical protein